MYRIDVEVIVAFEVTSSPSKNILIEFLSTPVLSFIEAFISGLATSPIPTPLSGTKSYISGPTISSLVTSTLNTPSCGILVILVPSSATR